ncbi:glycoside hydrolase family 9 protein [Marinoscillum sp.]|uniref:glycoside hydrolase family 9 protein n=1 Tax=Marinoscillum sp. TaxID=2024838 RepID=UPI003BAADAA0
MRIFLSIIALCCSVLSLPAQSVSPFIVVDQFGYLPSATKIAVIRNPMQGYDADLEFNPGSTYQVLDASTNEVVYSAAPVQWNGGQMDNSSGDQVWLFDFTEVATVGSYYVLDESSDEHSAEFMISRSVYNEVLKHAVRTFFYQRAGYAKSAEYAGEEWADGASHLGPNQDAECRRFDAKNDPSSARDLSGGWYDAGDYNKYTNWTANYVVDMLLSYIERPDAWGDDYGLPDSGNGIPDLIDEVKWGIAHLKRMQEEDGSVLSIVGLAHASPPSKASEPSFYGPASTSATLNTAAAFALAAKVFGQLNMAEDANELSTRALDAWEWAESNPNVLFRNNDSEYGSQGLGAGQQEESDYQRSMSKLEAAIYLFDLTGEKDFQQYVDAHYQDCHLIAWNYAYPFESFNQDMLLYYANSSEASSSVSEHILEVYSNQILTGSDNLPAIKQVRDPYGAFIKDYTWGSNSIKYRQANMFMSMAAYHEASQEELTQAASGYIHYLHGVNPFNLVYLSNMYRFGAVHSVNEFYHSWFADGSTKWDRVGESIYGPAPGFLVGGPNPSYTLDSCCPEGCGSSANNSVCTSEELDPPMNQPAQKSYKDFNTSWPLNSWSVTENSNSYQLAYTRLLSKFVDLNYDCMGVEDGDAVIDACGNCAGGTSGLTPVSNSSDCRSTLGIDEGTGVLYPNPANDRLNVRMDNGVVEKVLFYHLSGELVKSYEPVGDEIDLKPLPAGVYLISIISKNQKISRKLVKQ